MDTMTPPKRSKILYFVGIFIALFGLIFAMVGVGVINSETRYGEEGITVVGTVIGKNVEYRRDSDNHNKSTPYYTISYRFIPEGKDAIEASSSVDSGEYNRAKTDAPISIQYIRTDPGTNRVAQKPDFVFGFVFGGIGSLLTLAGLGVIFYEVKQRRLIARLVRDGMMVEATVASVSPGSLTINNVQQWQVRYTFRDLKGQEIEGTTPHMAPEFATQWNIGDKGRVKYDRDNSTLNIWLGQR